MCVYGGPHTGALVQEQVGSKLVTDLEDSQGVQN